MSSDRVNKALLSGSFWTAFGEVVGQLATLATTILGARLLKPRDFGLMGTVLLTMSILEHFSQTGFDAALIQKKEDIEEYLNVAWTWHVGRGALITALLCGLAWPISLFYDEPMLLPLMLCVSVTAVITGASNIGTVYFTRDLEFRTIFYIKGGTTLLRLLVFIPAIFYFRNVWALVVSHIGTAVVHIVVTYVSHPFRPKLAFDRKRLEELIGYGKWITGLAWIGFFIGKGDDVFVSKYIGITALGLYIIAYDVSNMPTINITHVIGRVGMPTYSRLQDDKEGLKRAFINVMRATLMISGPVSVFIYIMVPDIVAHVIGSQWEPAIPLVRILVISGFIRSFAALAGPLFQGTGRPDYDFKMNFPRFLVVVLGLWPFAHYWGLAGVCWVVTIAISTCLPTWFVGVKRITGLAPLRVLSHNLLGIFSSIILGATLYFARSLFGEAWYHAIAGIAVGLVGWLAALGVLGLVTPWSFYGDVKGLIAAIKAASKGKPEEAAEPA